MSTAWGREAAGAPASVPIATIARYKVGGNSPEAMSGCVVSVHLAGNSDMSAIVVDASALRRRRLTVRRATAADRRTIYAIRHDVYARELGQHACNAASELTDGLDEFNEYLVVGSGTAIAGFLSITPPGGRYSLDKYLPRSEWPFAVDDGLYELRLLTVIAADRSGPVAMLLMHAARRYLEERVAGRVMAIGRREVLDLYLKIGSQRHGATIRSGAVEYELLSTPLSDIVRSVARFDNTLERLSRRVDWRLECAFADAPAGPPSAPPACFHGGAFFEAIGPGFESLDRRRRVINADVLDAWFPPAPGVLDTLKQHLEWTLRTSPPTDCSGLLAEIARARHVPLESLVPGAGSSDLLFRACLRWLTRESRVLLLDPTYGEYAHVLERVVKCRVDRLLLRRELDYAVDVDELSQRLQLGYDLAIIVDPNNPTGQYVPRAELQAVLSAAPRSTRIWVDEAYLEYVGAGESLEQFAAASENVVVCKSMSKVYALSGARVAYLCGPQGIIRDLRSITPPWVVGLPAQISGVMALRDPGYYERRYAQTRMLRDHLAEGLRELGLFVRPGAANFVLCRRPRGTTHELLARCCEQRLFLREVSSMMSRPESGLFRVAVKDPKTNARILAILRAAREAASEQ